ncbi:hypothetical protein SLE2022_101440 [Rubroshorea leprosula]
MEEDDDHEDENSLFEGEGLNVEIESDTPPHLRELAVGAQLGDVDALRRAIDNLNGSINEPAEDGDTALHLACLYGHLPCVQLLLERGTNLEAKDEMVQFLYMMFVQEDLLRWYNFCLTMLIMPTM